jgi:hypothetical protein
MSISNNGTILVLGLFLGGNEKSPPVECHDNDIDRTFQKLDLLNSFRLIIN